MFRDSEAKDLVRRLWEVCFSLHLAFAGMSVVLIASETMPTLFGRMESRINNFLHISQTDFIRGYFGIWVPTVLGAFLIWILLRAFHRGRYTQEFLRSVAGLITILTPPTFWVVVYVHMSWSFAARYRSVIEVTTALVCTLLFLSGKRRVPTWIGFIFLIAHYAFWYYIPGSEHGRPSYLGPFGPLLGLCSAVVWFLYASRLGYVRWLGTPPTN